MASMTAADVIAQEYYKTVKKAPLDRYKLVKKIRFHNISKQMSVLN
jgi:hypothetical protein